MAGPNDQSNVSDAFAETVVVAFELLDSEVPKVPERIIAAVQSAQVQEAIKKAFEDYARSRLTSMSRTVTPQEAEELAKTVATAGGNALAQNVIDQIKKSAKFQKLDASLSKLTDDLKKTPMGVWIDENQKWLFIVGAGAFLGGAAAMYVTRSGDPLTKLIPTVKWPGFSVGTLQVISGSTKLNFTPSKRVIEVQTNASAKWQKIKAELNFTVTVTDGKVAAKADGKIVVPLGQHIEANIGAAGNTATKDWRLNIGVDVKVDGGLRLGIFAGAGKPGTLPPLPGQESPAPSPTGPARTGVFGGVGATWTF